MYTMVIVPTLDNNDKSAKIITSWKHNKLSLETMLNLVKGANMLAEHNYDVGHEDKISKIFLLKDVYANVIMTSRNLDLYKRRVRGE
nr:MAG TPA: hypothetical protein [Caudoviricetes sp.]